MSPAAACALWRSASTTWSLLLRSERDRWLRGQHHRHQHRRRDFTKVSEDDLSKGELQFGLPAALVVLLLVFGTLTGAAIPMLMALLSIIVTLGIAAVVGHASS